MLTCLQARVHIYLRLLFVYFFCAAATATNNDVFKYNLTQSHRKTRSRSPYRSPNAMQALSVATFCPSGRHHAAEQRRRQRGRRRREDQRSVAYTPRQSRQPAAITSRKLLTQTICRRRRRLIRRRSKMWRPAASLDSHRARSKQFINRAVYTRARATFLTTTLESRHPR